MYELEQSLLFRCLEDEQKICPIGSIYRITTYKIIIIILVFEINIKLVEIHLNPIPFLAMGFFLFKGIDLALLI